MLYGLDHIVQGDVVQCVLLAGEDAYDEADMAMVCRYSRSAAAVTEIRFKKHGMKNVTKNRHQNISTHH